MGSLGQGGYNPAAPDPADAGAMSSSAWELCLLTRHFHPHVAQAAATVAQIPPGGGSGNLTGAVNSTAPPAQLAGQYAFESTGLMRPAPDRSARNTGRSKAPARGAGMSSTCTRALVAYQNGVPVVRTAAGLSEDLSQACNEAALHEELRLHYG